MAQSFKPQVYIHTNNGKENIKVYNTYAELKKNLSKHLDESIDNKVEVSRHRRGEWGEWFEYWGFNAKRKPTIIEQGWL